MICVGYLDLATPLLAVLFSLFALQLLRSVNRQKIVAISLFVILVLGIFTGFVSFINISVNDLPKIIEDSIPAVLDLAKKYEVDLPFSDIGDIKALTGQALKDQLGKLARFAQVATMEFVYLIIGLVVAISLFINSQIDLDKDKHRIKNNLYSLVSTELARRFRSLYQSFSIVMGAQLVISTINTICTGIFIFLLGLPYFALIVVITFLCGLLPIVGNIISNTIIFAVAIRISLEYAIIVLVFLIVLHKFEYFLNGKIIGGRIKNPMWLTLLALIIGQRVLGVPGMILAPVVLYYLKLEGTKYEVEILAPKQATTPP